MLYSELKQQVIYNLGNKDSDEVIAMILGKINIAIKFLDASGEWEELESIVSPSLVVDQTEYTFTELSITNMRKIYSFSVFDGDQWRQPLIFIPAIEWVKKVLPVFSTLEDVPVSYTIFSKKIIVDRKPQSTYLTKILTYNHPTLVTGDASVIPFENMESVVEALVTWLCSMALQDLKTASAWKAVAMTLLNSYNIDSRRVLNLESGSKLVTASTPDYLNPFVHSTR